jgi:hypothetical protein
MPHCPEVHRWYCTASWQRRRRHVQPLCELFSKSVAATGADHIEPHRGNYELFRLGKLRSLCAECHNALDGQNRAPVRSRSPVRPDGTPTDPRHPWNAGS